MSPMKGFPGESGVMVGAVARDKAGPSQATNGFENMHLVVEGTVEAGLCQVKDGEQREQVITFRSLVFLWGGQSPAEPAMDYLV